MATCKLLSILIAPVFAKVGPVEVKPSPIFTFSVTVVKPVTANVLLTAMLLECSNLQLAICTGQLYLTNFNATL